MFRCAALRVQRSARSDAELKPGRCYRLAQLDLNVRARTTPMSEPLPTQLSYTFRLQAQAHEHSSSDHETKQQTRHVALFDCVCLRPLED